MSEPLCEQSDVTDGGLGDLLGAELLGGRQVLAVVVTEMVVRDDGGGLDAGRDEEIDEDGLHLGLAGLMTTAIRVTPSKSRVNNVP